MKLRTFIILFIIFLISTCTATLYAQDLTEDFNMPLNKSYTNEFGQTCELFVGTAGLFDGEFVVYIVPEEQYNVGIYIILVEHPELSEDSSTWITNSYEVDRLVLSNRRTGIAKTLKGEDMFIKQVEFFTIILEVEEFYTEDHQLILRNGPIADYYR